jgi:hypothetical protein
MPFLEHVTLELSWRRTLLAAHTAIGNPAPFEMMSATSAGTSSGEMLSRVVSIEPPSMSLRTYGVSSSEYQSGGFVKIDHDSLQLLWTILTDGNGILRAFSGQRIRR